MGFIGGYMKLDIPKRFYSDIDWAFRHYNNLVNKYEDTWVAIYNKKVVSSSDDGYKARDIAKKKTKAEKIPIIFISKMSRIY